MARLLFITPCTLEEMKVYEKEIAYLQSLIPFPHWSKSETEAFMEASIGELTLIYLDHLLVGSFSIELHSRRVAEIHGSVNPLIKNNVEKQQNRLLLNQIYEKLFHRVFLELHQRALIAKIHPLGKGSLGFVRHYGFRKVHSQSEESIWVLRKENYLNKGSKIHGQEKNS